MPRPLAVVLGWVAATAAAVAVAYAAVSTVAGGVVEPLPATLGQSPSVDGAPSGTASTEATTGSPTPSTSPSASPSASPRPGTSPSPAVAPSARPTAAPSSPPPPAASEVRSHALVGGTATLRYEPGRITVLSAEPAQGFTVQIEGNGTAEVRVEFDGDDHRSRLRASWEGGPRARIDEDDDRDDDPDEVDEPDEPDEDDD